MYTQQHQMVGCVLTQIHSFYTPEEGVNWITYKLAHIYNRLIYHSHILMAIHPPTHNLIQLSYTFICMYLCTYVLRMYISTYVRNCVQYWILTSSYKTHACAHTHTHTQAHTPTTALLCSWPQHMYSDTNTNKIHTHKHTHTHTHTCT